MTDITFTVSQLAKRWQKSRDHVRTLIESGQLVAFDTSPTAQRRSYRVTAPSLASFESRSVKSIRKTRKQKLPNVAVKKFF